MADIIDHDELDKDTVEADVLQEQFSKKYKLLIDKTVSKKSYINKLHLTKSLKLAISLDNNSIEVYQLNNTDLVKVCNLSGHKKKLSEVVFSPLDDHLLYSAGHDGVVKLWDTRASGSCVQEYKDDDSATIKPYDCLDISCDGRVVCAGSQLVEDDAYLVFWEHQKTSALGGYWNSHTDDITQVKFHPHKPEVLATGSTDSLLNIFNIREPTEDDALTYSLNIENSVEKLSWLDEKTVAVITQSNDLQLWDVEGGDQIGGYDRDKVARSIKRSKGDDCYLVDAYCTSDDTRVLLAGSHGGDGALRSVALKGTKLKAHSLFAENAQLVRCCHYDATHDILATAGEGGAVAVWRGASVSHDPLTPTPFCTTTTTISTISKTRHGKHSHSRHKPY